MFNTHKVCVFFLGHRQTLASVGRFVRPSYEMGIDASKVCEQHRRRPACASAQSDQRLCYLLYLDLLRTKFQFSS